MVGNRGSTTPLAYLYLYVYIYLLIQYDTATCLDQAACERRRLRACSTWGGSFGLTPACRVVALQLSSPNAADISAASRSCCSSDCFFWRSASCPRASSRSLRVCSSFACDSANDCDPEGNDVGDDVEAWPGTSPHESAGPSQLLRPHGLYKMLFRAS